MKRAFLTGSTICGLLATLPAQAPAANYTVYACSAGVDGGVNRSWTTWSTGNGYRASEDCAPGNPNPGGLRIRQNTMPLMQLGSQTEWVFRAPSGTTIRTMSGYRYLYDGWEDQTPYIRNATGWLESCPIAYTAAYCLLGSGGYGVGYPTWFSYPVGTGEVAMGVKCTENEMGACAGGVSNGTSWVHMQLTNIRVEVSDPHRAVVAHVQGDLTQGWVRGTRAVTLTATDAQSGVGRLRVILARPGTPGAVITQDVACNYTLAVPCPTSVTHGFGVNTTTLPDGAYTFEASATDATLAEANLGTLTGTVRIDNTAPAAPALTLAAGAIAPGAPITVTVKAPVDAGSPPVATNYRVTTPDGKVIATGTHKDASRIEGITAPAGRSTITAWMTDEAGNTDPTRSGSLVLDTSPPPSPTITTPGVWGTGSGSITLIQPTPAAPIAPAATMHMTVCPAGGPTQACITRTSTVPETGSVTHDLAGLAPGAWQATAWSDNQAGTTGKAAATTFAFTITTPPAPAPAPVPAPHQAPPPPAPTAPARSAPAPGVPGAPTTPVAVNPGAGPATSETAPVSPGAPGTPGVWIKDGRLGLRLPVRRTPARWIIQQSAKGQPTRTTRTTQPAGAAIITVPGNWSAATRITVRALDGKGRPARRYQYATTMVTRYR